MSKTTKTYRIDNKILIAYDIISELNKLTGNEDVSFTRILHKAIYNYLDQIYEYYDKFDDGINQIVMGYKFDENDYNYYLEKLREVLYGRNSCDN